MTSPIVIDSGVLVASVAERLGCDFWTFDKRLFNTVHEKLNWVHYVVNFSPPDLSKTSVDSTVNPVREP